MKNKKNYALERFKEFVNHMVSVNNDMYEGKITFDEAEKIMEKISRDSLGRQFCKYEVHYRDGHTHFEVSKKEVLKYML